MANKKKKTKKPNPKREKYAKFRKDKATNMTFSVPDLSNNQMKDRVVDETKVEKFWKFRRSPPRKEVRDRKLKSKR